MQNTHAVDGKKADGRFRIQSGALAGILVMPSGTKPGRLWTGASNPPTFFGVETSPSSQAVSACP